MGSSGPVAGVVRMLVVQSGPQPQPPPTSQATSHAAARRARARKASAPRTPAPKMPPSKRSAPGRMYPATAEMAPPPIPAAASRGKAQQAAQAPTAATPANPRLFLVIAG